MRTRLFLKIKPLFGSIFQSFLESSFHRFSQGLLFLFGFVLLFLFGRWALIFVRVCQLVVFLLYPVKLKTLVRVKGLASQLVHEGVQTSIYIICKQAHSGLFEVPHLVDSLMGVKVNSKRGFPQFSVRRHQTVLQGCPGIGPKVASSHVWLASVAQCFNHLQRTAVSSWLLWRAFLSSSKPSPYTGPLFSVLLDLSNPSTCSLPFEVFTRFSPPFRACLILALDGNRLC